MVKVDAQSLKDICAMLPQITDAIRNRKLISLTYDPGVRLIEPHAVGYGSEGQLLLRAWQVEGASASGEHENWKLFRIDRIASMSGLSGTFGGARTGYNPNDSAMKRGIIARL